MASSQMNRVLRSLRRAALRYDDGDMTDRQLLERFLTAREDAAFEALVRRHGPMVLGVCRRILAHHHDAEDAFQATFLVLVRKASSILARDTVGNWLYGVAYRTAQKARTAAARRRVKEKQMSRPEALEEDAWHELRPLLDQELNRLPDKYRAPVVLCDLEGNTRKEAAERLGWPEGTLSGRLSRARVLLAKRLARRGLTLSGGAVAVALSYNAASACLPAPLVSSTVQAAALVAAGPVAAGAISAPVVALTEGVLKAMFVTKLKIVTAVALTVGLLAVGFGLYQTGAIAQTPATPTVKALLAAAPVPLPAKEEGKKDDAKEDEKNNLPTGPAPVQVLVSLDKDGKLVVKHAMTGFRARGGGAVRPGAVPLPANQVPPPGAAVPPRGAGGANAAPANVQMVTTIQTQTVSVDDVEILDTKGKKVDKKELPKLLKEETVAMASLNGQPIDPLHLRVLKDGTLTFVLPAPKAIRGGGGGGGFGPGGPATPPPATVPPGAALPGAPEGDIPQPGNALPANPTTPPPARPKP